MFHNNENKQTIQELKTSQNTENSDVVVQLVDTENETPANKDHNQNSIAKNYEKEEFTISRAESPESLSSMSNDVEIFYKTDETDGNAKSKGDDEKEDKMLSVQELKKKFSSQSDEHKMVRMLLLNFILHGFPPKKFEKIYRIEESSLYHFPSEHFFVIVAVY